jgi:hypothetical protein
VRSAPPVVWPLGKPRFLTGVIAFAWLFSLSVGLSVVGADAIRVSVVFAVHALSVALLVAWWRSHGPGALWWNGQSWAWMPSKHEYAAIHHEEGALPHAATVEPGELVVCLDLQWAVLVQWRCTKARRGAWWWLPSQADPVHWAAFRRALYCAPTPLTRPEATRPDPFP